MLQKCAIWISPARPVSERNARVTQEPEPFIKTQMLTSSRS